LEHEEIDDTSQINGYTSDMSCVDNSTRLLEISHESKGLTGRTLRKIPFLAYALHLPASLTNEKITLSQFLIAMYATVIKQKQEPHLQQL